MKGESGDILDAMQLTLGCPFDWRLSERSGGNS
jgi:hypothetical protein